MNQRARSPRVASFRGHVSLQRERRARPIVTRHDGAVADACSSSPRCGGYEPTTSRHARRHTGNATGTSSRFAVAMPVEDAERVTPSARRDLIPPLSSRRELRMGVTATRPSSLRQHHAEMLTGAHAIEPRRMTCAASGMDRLVRRTMSRRHEFDHAGTTAATRGQIGAIQPTLRRGHSSNTPGTPRRIRRLRPRVVPRPSERSASS